jgi:hypothetical protein
LLDDDRESALRFLKKYLADKAKGILEGSGHCKPYLEVFGQNAVPSQFDRPADT